MAVKRVGSVLLAEHPHLDTVTDMSSDVGVGGQRERAVRSSKLRDALTGDPEVRGVDRILAESFWCASTRPRVAPPPIANVVAFPVRRT